MTADCVEEMTVLNFNHIKQALFPHCSTSLLNDLIGGNLDRRNLYFSTGFHRLEADGSTVLISCIRIKTPGFNNLNEQQLA